jgi:phenylalanyl-tRNA synthetase beta chain
MTISLNWLKSYLDIHLDAARIGELLTELGLEIEGMESVESIRGGLRGVVVGWVKACEKHPNADKLSLTKVDIGAESMLSIVCGAPNVAVGQKVLVATPGTTLYPTGSDTPLVLKTTKVRGELSEGMICAADELGIGTDHSGILVLPEDTPVGIPAADYFQVEEDVIYEIGLTPNRSDATNHIGVARDLAAALRINYGHEGLVRLPSVDSFRVHQQRLPIEVEVLNTDACPRYAGICITGVHVGESPEWLKRRLQSIGIRAINNVVDVTNFILHELGQPLHAFDYDAIAGQKVVVRTLEEGTLFTGLDGIERKLSAEDLIICDGHGNAMCIGGVFGGISSGVKEETRNIFLESAHFNARYIRRSSMRHNLRTEAARVFEKGSDPNVAMYALKRAAMLICEIAGGQISSDPVDIYPHPVSPIQVTLRYDHVSRLIGAEIPRVRLFQILDSLDMRRLQETEDAITVAVPTAKSDVTREVDVIEEILRIYGFNSVPIPTQIRTTGVEAPKPDGYALRNIVGDFLSASGFHEMMALSLSESRYYKELLPQIGDDTLVYIQNTSRSNLDIMRPTMLMSALEVARHNQNRQQYDLKLFEFGKTYRLKSESIDEQACLSVLLAGNRHAETWLAKASRPADFFMLKAYCSQIMARLGAGNYQESVVENPAFAYGVRFHRGERVFAELGKVSPMLCKGMDIRGDVYFADLNWDALVGAAGKQKIVYREVSKFPFVRRDLALIVENTVKFSDIAAIAGKVGKGLLKEVNLFDVYENEATVGAGKKSCAVSFVFEDQARTLQDKDVEKVMEQLIKDYETKLGALIRR